MSLQLTEQQELAINNTANTHDYMSRYELDEHEASIEADEHSDHIEYYTAQFEADTSVLERSTANDVGGIIIYMNASELVAYYDYENLCGTVFA
jgi:hypothetical protein